MAMQAGMGLSKVVLLVGAGFTLPIVLRNGRLSDILTEIQDMMKSLERSAGKAGDSDHADAVAAQVRRLAMEVRQLASARQPITVLTGGSGAGNVGSLIVPAATVGALGYGYMWWKGISFSDLMYVTKRNLATAVDTMKGQLEQLSSSLAAAKRHLTQRMENLDWKLDENNELVKDTKTQVTEVSGKVDEMRSQLNFINKAILGLDDRCLSMDEKQKFICAGVYYLCETVNNVKGVTDGSKTPGKRFLESTGPKGLQQISESIKAIMNDSDASGNLKTLSRGNSLER